MEQGVTKTFFGGGIRLKLIYSLVVPFMQFCRVPYEHNVIPVVMATYTKKKSGKSSWWNFFEVTQNINCKYEESVENVI